MDLDQWNDRTAPAREAIQEWIEVRGDWAGPFFCTLTRNHLTREQTWRIVKRVEKQANAQLPDEERFTVSPHTFRHTLMRKILRQKGPDYTVAQGGWRNKCYLWTYTEPSPEERPLRSAEVAANRPPGRVLELAFKKIQDTKILPPLADPSLLVLRPSKACSWEGTLRGDRWDPRLLPPWRAGRAHGGMGLSHRRGLGSGRGSAPAPSTLRGAARSFDGGPKPLKVLGHGLGQLVEFGEQLLGAGKRDRQPSGLEFDPCGEALDAVGGPGAQGDLDGGGLAVSASLVKRRDHPLAAALLVGESLAGGDLVELPDESEAIDEEGFAGLVAAEAVGELDGLPAFNAEEGFEGGAVEDGDLEGAELREDMGNS